MKRLAPLLLIVASFINTQAITDIRICHFNSDNPDDFSFVSLNPIVEGTQIHFTDMNWSSSRKQFTQGNEGTLLWEANTSVPAGTVIHISEGWESQHGSVEVVKSGFNLANKNDILWAYTVTNGTISVLTAVANGGIINDTTFAETGLSSVNIGVFNCDNGIYRGQRNLTELNWMQFYKTENWLFTSGTGSQYISVDTARFYPVATAPYIGASRHCLLEEYPQGWIGDTNSYTVKDALLTTVKTDKFSTIFYPLYNEDRVELHLNAWDFVMSTQNNYGIILTSNQCFSGNIGQASWVGYYMQIIGSRDSTFINLIYHSENTNKTTTRLCTIDLLKITKGIDFAFTYFANGKIGYRIHYGIDTALFIAADETEALYQDNPHFGIYSNLNPKTSSNISIAYIKTEATNNAYALHASSEFDNPQSWQPTRLLALRSDNLTIADIGTVVINDNMHVNSLKVKNSTVHLSNEGTKKDICLIVNSLLSVDASSQILLTNTKSSTKSCGITLNREATAEIFGTITFDGKGKIPKHRLSTKGRQGFVFKPNSKMIVIKQDGKPFFTASSAPAATFAPQSIFEQHEGESPFEKGNNPEAVVFQDKSIYQYFGGGLSWVNSNYSCLELLCEGNTNILIGGERFANIQHLKVLKGNYIFGLQTNKKPININVSDSLYIADGAKIVFAPVYQEATSIVNISGNYVYGNGLLEIGEYAELHINNSHIDWKLNTNIAGKIRFGDACIISLDSANMLISGEIINPSKNSYIATPENVYNQTAYIVRPVAGLSASVLFPVGTVSGGYMPVTISKNSGSDANFDVRGFSGIYENGLYGAESRNPERLHATWEITPDNPAIVDIEIAWEALSERSGFFRRNSHVIINHHRENNDNWIVLENSQFTETEDSYSLKTFAVSDFSTISAEGGYNPLAIYFEDFVVKFSGDRICSSWQQTVLVDSVLIQISADASSFITATTVKYPRIGRQKQSVSALHAPTNYVQLLMYSNGNIVETSAVKSVDIGKEEIGKLQIDINQNSLSITKNGSEQVKLVFYALNGHIIETIIIDSEASLVSVSLPDRCRNCIVHAESNSGRASIILPNRD